MRERWWDGCRQWGTAIPYAGRDTRLRRGQDPASRDHASGLVRRRLQSLEDFKLTGSPPRPFSRSLLLAKKEERKGL